MAVNEQIYGSADLWYNSSFQQQALTQKNRVAYFGSSILDRTLEKGVDAGKLSYNSGIDKSISYCGLGEQSALSHLVYAVNDNGVPSLIDRQDKDITNFAFFEKSSSAEVEPLEVYNFSTLYYFVWNAALNANNHQFNRWLAPLTKIIPKNVVLAINVICCQSDYNNKTVFPLNTYLSGNTPTVYPRIISVYVDAYIGNYAENIIPREILGGVPFGRYYIPFHLGLLDEYNIPTKSTNFYAYDFYHQSVFGNFSNSAAIFNNGDFMPVAFTEKSYSHIICEKIGNNCYISTEYYPEFEEDILKTVACFGLYFTGDLFVAGYGNLTHNDMYIGILDNDGVGRGKYLRGAETTNAPQNTWNDMSQAGYDYKTSDNTNYRNDTQFYAGYGTSSFTKFYALTETQVNQLSQELYRIANDVPSGTSITEYNMKMFLTNNPIDCIISLKKFPVENIPLASSDATIYLGAKATNITGKILATPTWVYYFNFKNSENQSCFPYFGGNFLDYEPYTKCKIVIPFCGTVDVPVSYIYQYDDLQIALVMDFITGATTAYVKVNGITIDSITGSCAIDLPVSGIQSATLDSQIHSVAMAREKQQTTLGTGLIAGAVSIGIGLATGSLPVAIGGGAAIIGSFMHASDTGKQINYDLSHMETPVKQVTAASGQIAHTYDMRCKMVITRPEIAAEYSAEEYSKTIGFACLENGSMQQFHGLTVANIDLSGINCTAQEKELIRAAFASGVYLPAEYSDTYWT